MTVRSLSGGLVSRIPTRPFFEVPEVEPYTPRTEFLEQFGEFIRTQPFNALVFRGGINPDEEDKIPSIKELRQWHNNRCRLVAAALIDRYQRKYRVVEENHIGHFKKGTKEHMDGLSGQYWQAHTTMGGAPSFVTLKRFNVDREAHEKLQEVRDEFIGNGIVPNASVAVKRKDWQHLGSPELTLQAATDGLSCEVAQVICRIGDTIIFRNGYDTQREYSTYGAEENLLITHEFNPACNQLKEDPSRIVTISRIETSV